MRVSTLRTLRSLNLRERSAAGEDGGVFHYYSPDRKAALTFRWDGAGITREGDTVVIEEEKPPYSRLHIQGHLARIGVMLNQGERVRKLIWLVPSDAFVDLDRIVWSWIQMSEVKESGRFPAIEYRNYDGRYLAALGVSTN
jgi:hypothetical protein